MSSITLNAVVFGAGGSYRGPSDIQTEPEKIAIVLPAADGTRNMVYRGQKQKWTYEWDGVSETTKSAIRGIFNLTTTFTHVDIVGGSYTCQCEPGDYKESVSAVMGDGSPHYRVSLTVRQA